MRDLTQRHVGAASGCRASSGVPEKFLISFQLPSRATGTIGYPRQGLVFPEPHVAAACSLATGGLSPVGAPPAGSPSEAMKAIPYVNEVSAERAREWERRFQRLPRDAGVIFISITAVPEIGGDCHVYEVRLG